MRHEMLTQRGRCKSWTLDFGLDHGLWTGIWTQFYRLIFKLLAMVAKPTLAVGRPTKCLKMLHRASC